MLPSLLRLRCQIFVAVAALWCLSAQAAWGQGPLSLADAVAQALAKNPEIQVLQQRLQAAEARAKQSTYLEDPEIALRLGGIPLAQPTALNRADTNSIGIRQKLPFFGKLALQEKIAVQESQIMEQELRAKEREIAARVKMTYADLFMAQRLLEIAREQLEINKAIIKTTESRYQVGRVMQQDVLRALLEQSDIMNQLILAEQVRKTAQVKLNVAMNQAPQTPLEVTSDLPLAEASAGAAQFEEWALVNRPELRGAEREIERSERLYELADKNRKFPDFMVGWDYERMPTEMTKNRYSAMFNIMIPFSPWTAGKRNYQVEEALAQIRAAKFNREAMKNMTLSEVGELKAKLEAANKSLELYREGILPQAQLSFEASMAAYQTGRAEFVALLESQRALREAKMGYFKSQVALLQSRAELERVVGKELQ